MLVKSNCEGLVGLNLSNTVPTEILPLKRGWNEVDDALWRRARVLYKESIAKGKYEELGKDVYEDVDTGNKDEAGNPIMESRPTFQGSAFNKLGASKAAELVSECWDKKTLKYWYSIEGRDDVRLKISKQLDLISHPRLQDEDEE